MSNQIIWKEAFPCKNFTTNNCKVIMELEYHPFGTPNKWMNLGTEHKLLLTTERERPPDSMVPDERTHDL